MSVLSKIKARVTSTRVKTRAIAAGFTIAIASIAAVATMGAAAAAPVSTPDCDSNAVVWCGATSVSNLQSKYNAGDGHNKAYSIQDVYNAFGIGPSNISAMKSDAVAGYVTSTGDVYATINGKSTLVATSAVTAGRTLLYKNGKVIPGQIETHYGETTFYKRATSVSFAGSELSAMVIMSNGVFQHAILNSCGNPINATPKKPNYSIVKQVRAGTSGSYSSGVTVQSGSTVEYQITASSTGAIPVDNVTVRDTLPSGITYDSGTLQENGKAVSSADASKFFTTGGLNVGTITNGGKDVFTFQAKAGSVAYTDSSCKAASLNNTGYISAPGLSGGQSSAKVSTTCAPPASLSCTSLTGVAGTADATTGDQSYSFTAKSAASNATITSYTFNFGDGKSASVSSSSTSAATTHTYVPGTYTATVTVNATANGKTVTATAPGCQYKVTVTPPASGTLVCENLTATPGQQNATTGDTPYTLTGKGQANGNATISQYVFTPAAGVKTIAVNSSSTSASTTYTYAPGTYTASVQVLGTDTATSKSVTAPANQACTVSITVKTPAKPNYSIVKQVSTSANGSFGTNVTVKSGATVYYKVTVSSTGNVPVTNVNVHDTLPKYLTYMNGTLQENGTAISSANASSFFGNGLVVASINNGSSVVFTYSAVAGNTATDTDPACMAQSLTNTGYISTTGLGNEQSSAAAKTTCTQVQGSLACVSLSAIAGAADSAGNQSYTFTGNATASNAAIKTYTFTITNTATNKVVATIPVSSSATSVTTPSAQQLAPGNYSVSVVVAGTDNYGNALQAPTNAKCATTFNISTPECKPGVVMGSSECYTYTCNDFTLTIDNSTRTATVASFNATSTNAAAALANVSISWGDGATTLTPNASPVGQSHVFTANNSTVTATAQFTTPTGTTPVSSTVCSQPVSFTTTTVTPPPVLPNTGAGDTIAIFVGTVAAGTIAGRLFLGRKLARR